MVRRVGFGNTGNGNEAGPLELPEAGSPAPEGVTGAPGRPPKAVPEQRWVRFAIAAFIAIWLAAWTWGVWFAFDAIGTEWISWGQESFDWFAFGFLAIWLFFALIGWAFGAVILIVLLFGKPVTPERRVEREARRAARRAARGR